VVTSSVSIKVQDATPVVRWPHGDADLALPSCASLLHILAKEAIHVQLNVMLYGRKEKHALPSTRRDGHLK
jgi:hypothetical protein